MRFTQRGNLTNPDGSLLIYFLHAKTVAPWNYFGFNPSMAAAITLCVAFGITTIICLTNLLRHRKDVRGRFLHIFVFCPLAKTVGYALRAVAAQDPTNF